MDGVVEQVRIARQFDEVFRSAVGASGVVIENALTDGAVGGVLVLGFDGGVDIKAAGVAFCAVLGIDELTHHFGYVATMHLVIRSEFLDHQGRSFCRVSLRLGDEAVFHHAVENVELPDARTLGVDNRVVQRRRFRQARQHSRFSQVDVLDGLAEIGFCSGGKAIGPVSQEDLVHVDFQDLVLGQRVLHLECQQHFVDFALDGLFR